MNQQGTRIQSVMSGVEHQNPSTTKVGQRLVTDALASVFEDLEDKVPPAWLPRLKDVHPTRKAGEISGLTIKYGCGVYGCVIPTLDKKVVLKITTDSSEGEFASRIAHTLVAPVVVEYLMAVKLRRKLHGLRVYLLWREAAEHVGKIGKVVSRDAEALIDNQQQAAQPALALAHAGGKEPRIRKELEAWVAACQAMIDSGIPEIKPLGEGFLKIYREQGILFGDVHSGNVGLVGDRWLVTDPGNILVLR